MHHVQAQAALYKNATNAQLAWVVNFTTVPPSLHPAKQYPFVAGSEVNVMHVHLHDNFTQADIYVKDKPKVGPIRLGNPLRGTVSEFVSLVSCASAHRAFDLEGFLRDDANIDADSVKKLAEVLKNNKVDRAAVPLLTDAMLQRWGITADIHRAKILAAAEGLRK